MAAVIVGIGFQSAVIQMSFDINQQYIANALCINKSKPMLNCEGKCYLKRQLTESSEDGQERQQNINNKLSINWLLDAAVLKVTPQEISILATTFEMDDAPYWSFVNEIDHPPA